jgi:CheY-like chemotaxis protein
MYSTWLPSAKRRAKVKGWRRHRSSTSSMTMSRCEPLSVGDACCADLRVGRRFPQRARRPDAPGCLILDVRLPGMSGLDFQAQLGEAGIELPVILMTGYGDVPMSVRGMKAGAVDFLIKPFRDQEMLDAVAVTKRRCSPVSNLTGPKRAFPSIPQPSSRPSRTSRILRPRRDSPPSMGANSRSGSPPATRPRCWRAASFLSASSISPP